MSRFEREWAVVPGGARWTAALVGLGFVVLLWGVVLIPAFVHRRLDGLQAVVLPVMSLVGAGLMTVYVLLIGYVWGDARRRGMKHVMWTLLAIFIPNAIGIILYFILRDPLPTSCPACGAPEKRGHPYCAHCGTALRPTCPRCGQPVESVWRNCAHCGTALAAGVPPGSRPQGGVDGSLRDP